MIIIIVIMIVQPQYSCACTCVSVTADDIQWLCQDDYGWEMLAVSCTLEFFA